MKKISVLIPTYNEEDNVREICAAVKEQLLAYKDKYEYEIVFIDNDSGDSTRLKIAAMCAEDKNVKAIFNAKNFGQGNSPYYGMCQTTGDCAILMVADFQTPPDVIPRLISEWENGCKIVCLIKSKSHENPVMRLIRSVYYRAVKALSRTEMIEHFTGEGLYDRDFLDVLRGLDDSEPFLRGIVAELGFKRKDIVYTQQKRRGGKSSNNLLTLYDYAMVSITAYTKAGLRLAVFLGIAVSLLSFLIAVVYFALKLIFWDSFPVGIAPLIIGMFFLGGVQLFFLGFLGEYIMSIHKRMMKRPLVVEERRINFE